MSDSVHDTLVANTVKTVTLDRFYAEVEVTVVTPGTAPIYYLVNPGAADPTVKGRGTEVLPAAVLCSNIVKLFDPAGPDPATVVKLISASAVPDITVTGR